ncbi:MAG: APC family permease [Synergistaceae bacterium]|nr:APC family permease [Synergistaceae bacterium]
MLFFNFDAERHLDRKLTPINVWSLAFGCVIGWSAYVMPGTIFLKNAGPIGTLIAMELATFTMLVISYNYSYMIHKFPMTGGEFIYAKMAFGARHGFICAWFLSLSYLSVIPLNATALNLIMRAVFGDLFQFGFHYSIAGYDIYFGEMLVVISALIIFGVIDSFGVNFTGRLQTFLVMILLGGILFVIGGTIFSPRVNASNIQPMFHPIDAKFDKSIISQIIAVAVTAPMSFIGFDTVPQMTEESNFSPDSTKIVMDTSIICGGFVYIALTFLACSIFPAAYNSWPEYINDISNLNGVTAFPTLNAASMIMGRTGLFFIVASVFAAMLTGIIGFYIATSRLLYSMARDKMIPEWFGRLNRNNVPTNAAIFCMTTAGIASLLGRAILGWIFDMASIGGAIGFAYTSISACKYAFHERRLDIIIFGLLGFIFSWCFALLLLVPIPGLNVSIGKESYGLLLVWIALGITFYTRSKKK